jgi:hypothetical protein
MRTRPTARAMRPRFWQLWLSLLILCLSTRVVADDVVVPISLQMDLMLKVASYDKNLAERAGGALRITVLLDPGNPDSVRSGAQALKALSAADDVAGLPVELSSTPYVDAPALARLVRERHVSILYVTLGFSELDVDAMAHALDGVSVLSVGALGKYASRGVVLGFDLVGGKPKLIVNLGLAKRQRVELSSAVLKLMRVVE